MRKKIIAQLGSNVFKTAMYKYKPDGQATNCVIIAKVPGGVSLANKLVQNCRRTAEASAPQYVMTTPNMSGLTPWKTVAAAYIQQS